MISSASSWQTLGARALGAMTLAALSIAILSQSAGAQPQRLCGGRDAMLERLDKSYREKPQAIGLSADGGNRALTKEPARRSPGTSDRS